MRRVVLPSLLASVLLMPVLAWSQEATPQPPTPQPPTPAVAPKPMPSPKTTSVYVIGDYLLGVGSSEALQARIDLEAKDMPALDAIKSVLDQAKVKYEIAPDATTDVKITMTLKNVPASYALMMLVREAKLNWYYEKKDNQETLRVTKRDDRFHHSVRVDVPGVKMDMPGMEHALRSYIESSRVSPLAMTRAFTMPASLPDVRVKIDVRNTDARDILKKVLEQAKVDYVLDDDVPSDAKRSFTFENIPLSTALDMVCQSVEIGWRAEMRDKKVTVLVGKKYRNRPWISVGPRTSVAMSPSMPATIYATPIAERRATFVCPHCKARAVVVLRNSRSVEHVHGEVQGKDKEKEKEANRPWKFCPVCGKSIDMGANVRNETPGPLSRIRITSCPEVLDIEETPFSRSPELAPLVEAEQEAVWETASVAIDLPMELP